MVNLKQLKILLKTTHHADNIGFESHISLSALESILKGYKDSCRGQ